MVEALWWQRDVIYQIYPRSYQDSNGDGIGDLAGIVRRLDYLAELGVGALWLSPIYPSPMADFGYDVAEYCGIDPVFGTLADFDQLVAAAHGRGLKLILDLVPNHTSDQHPWFRESRASRESPKRDFYLWRDPAPDGGPPNNWLSHFGGGAWAWDAATRQYYYHSFLKQQPDLNWRNPSVRTAIYDVMRFWLDRGVDGFRVDVLWLLIKDDQFRDNPPNPGYRRSARSHDSLLPLYTADRPEVHEIVAEMRSLMDHYPERVLIGEIYLPIERLVTYYGRDLTGAHLPFNFQLLLTEWRPAAIARIIAEYEAALPAGAWPNWVLGNHDRPRVASRIGLAQARVAAMLLLTLRGTPTIYYGEEVGMLNVPIAADRVQDPAERNEPGIGLGRDPVRTPMPWDASSEGGFTAARAWLPLGPDHTMRNVETSSSDRASILSLYRRLIALRRQRPSLVGGAIDGVAVTGDVLVYDRQAAQEQLRIALNMSGQPQYVDGMGRRVLLSTYLDREGETVDGAVMLRPDEGLILTP